MSSHIKTAYSILQRTSKRQWLSRTIKSPAGNACSQMMAQVMKNAFFTVAGVVGSCAIYPACEPSAQSSSCHFLLAFLLFWSASQLCVVPLCMHPVYPTLRVYPMHPMYPMYPVHPTHRMRRMYPTYRKHFPAGKQGQGKPYSFYEWERYAYSCLKLNSKIFFLYSSGNCFQGQEPGDNWPERAAGNTYQKCT